MERCHVHSSHFVGCINSSGLLLYHLKVSLFKDPKKKFDYINANEIRWYKRVFFFIGLTIACAINMYGYGRFTELDLMFFVRLFLSIAFATLISYVATLILQYYYPTKLNFKLRKLRYSPRINPKNGHKMRLLSEDEIFFLLTMMCGWMNRQAM